MRADTHNTRVTDIVESVTCLQRQVQFSYLVESIDMESPPTGRPI